MVTGIKKWKTLTKHMNVNVKLMKQNVSQIKYRITINVDVSVKKYSVKNIIYVKNNVWNPATCNCENGEYLASIMNEWLSDYLWRNYIRRRCC